MGGAISCFHHHFDEKHDCCENNLESPATESEFVVKPLHELKDHSSNKKFLESFTLNPPAKYITDDNEDNAVVLFKEITSESNNGSKKLMSEKSTFLHSDPNSEKSISHRSPSVRGSLLTKSSVSVMFGNGSGNSRRIDIQSVSYALSSKDSPSFRKALSKSTLAQSSDLGNASIQTRFKQSLEGASFRRVNSRYSSSNLTSPENSSSLSTQRRSSLISATVDHFDNAIEEIILADGYTILD